MKIVSFSDNHGLINFDIPKCDILTIGGDICPSTNHDIKFQEMWIKKNFIPWLKSKIKKGVTKDIVLCAGNHDLFFQDLMKYDIEDAFRKTLPAHIHYLSDSNIEIDGLSIYGTPWTVEFCGWAFMKYDDLLEDIFEDIPETTDVLISHGPAFGTCDTIEFNPSMNLGSRSLRNRILKTNINWLLSGHIHSASHEENLIDRGNSVCKASCVSIVNEDYKIAYEPLITEI
jgi:Icc-related predicted phosphoesterase